MEVFAAVDIGGTKVRVEVFGAESGWEGRPLATRLLQTPRSGEVLGEIEREIREAVDEAGAAAGAREGALLAVGVGAPGPLDPRKGVVLNPPNLSEEWWSLNVVEGLGERLGCPVGLENDCNLGALGESEYGGGRGFGSTFYITVSTGVGGGFVVEGEVFGGTRGFAVEIGHVTITDRDYPCGCGRRGCVESAVSGRSIARRARESGWIPPSGGTGDSLLDSRIVSEAAAAGDETARGIIAEAAGHLGRAIVDFVYSYDPAVVLLGGGVSQSDLFVELVRKAVEEEPMMPAFRGAPVLRASLGERSVVCGAFVLSRRLAEA